MRRRSTSLTAWRGEWTLPTASAVIWWTDDGRRAAYTVGPAGAKACQMLLAGDPALAREVVARIRPASLQHHPVGWLARHVLDADWASCRVEIHEAATACELQDGALRGYLEAIESGSRTPGTVRYPLPFMCD